MPEITIISGKGGTGKTTITGALAHLARGRHLVCDLDVDAPDLHLLLQPVKEQTEDFMSGHEAVIDQDKCQDCGLCAEMCRFNAVKRNQAGPVIDPLACEGCKVCVHFCPEEAIDFPLSHCGQWYVSQTRFGPMVHAQLFPGQENSGLLVSLLRQKARDLAQDKEIDLILSDGAPGIGCPVISSLSGTDLAVLVTEPTPSGRHDLERVADLCAHFSVPVTVIINKHDLNPAQAQAIKDYCAGRGVEVVAELPHDRAVTEAMVQGRVITEFQQGGTADLIRGAWERIEALARIKAAA
ncbi:MAG: ATP-binding protein [Deltaproteobacteria bacterium]|nr:ATP-binding protein [Deltaproteobacteria bacterium]